MSGQETQRADISNITNADPCIVTTDSDHGFSTLDQVRLTGLNGMMPTPRGVDPLNNYRFEIVVTSGTQFSLKNPITHLNIDSTAFPPYVEGGSANVIATSFVYEGD